MIRYILRRLIQMVPTMLGVVLVTFFLFNLVGGSPARMVLGDKASAKDLEDFDEQRGFNRPLFWGRASPTRLYTATDLQQSAGPWTAVSGVVWTVRAGLRIEGPAEVPIPLAFGMPAGRRFEWAMEYRLQGAASLKAVGSGSALSSGGMERLVWVDGDEEVPPDYRPTLQVAAGSVLDVVSLQCARLNARPWESQWTHYLGQLARLDFGRSHSANRAVVDLLGQGILPTLLLAAPILAGETLASLALALVCAYWRNRLTDRLILVGCVMLMSVNYLVWIVAGQYWLGYRLNMFPVWGFESWSYLLLPILIGILHGLGPNVRFYRAIILEEMHKDYVRTARAKGAGPGSVLFVHVLKNAMIPVITNVVLSLPFLYTGSLLLESYFGIPGLGYLSVNAINSSDVDVVRAVVLIGSFLYLATNLLADLAYAWVDPRVKLS